MGVLSNTRPTLMDVAKRTDPNGAIADIAELLAQANDILLDMPWKEGNLEVGHRLTVRTGMPVPTWRQINQGVAATKSNTTQFDETCGMLEARGEVDKDLAMLNGNTNEFRLSENSAQVEAMGQEFAGTVFYGNASIDKEQFSGIAPRMNSLSASNGKNIINCGGSGGDLTSIYLVVWGFNTVFGIYPKGSKAGLVHEDLKEGDAFDASNNRFRAYMDRWQMKGGIAVKDWRFLARAANIDVSNLVDESSDADLIKTMIKLVHRIPGGYGGLRAGGKEGRAAFYMNRTLFQMLDIQRRDNVKAGGGLSFQDVDGMATPTFRQIPIRVCDQILETESQVT